MSFSPVCPAVPDWSLMEPGPDSSLHVVQDCWWSWTLPQTRPHCSAVRLRPAAEGTQTNLLVLVCPSPCSGIGKSHKYGERFTPPHPKPILFHLVVKFSMEVIYKQVAQ